MFFKYSDLLKTFYSDFYKHVLLNVFKKQNNVFNKSEYLIKHVFVTNMFLLVY